MVNSTLNQDNILFGVCTANSNASYQSYKEDSSHFGRFSPVLSPPWLTFWEFSWHRCVPCPFSGPAWPLQRLPSLSLWGGRSRPRPPANASVEGTQSPWKRAERVSLTWRKRNQTSPSRKIILWIRRTILRHIFVHSLSKLGIYWSCVIFPCFDTLATRCTQICSPFEFLFRDCLLCFFIL